MQSPVPRSPTCFPNRFKVGGPHGGAVALTHPAEIDYTKELPVAIILAPSRFVDDAFERVLGSKANDKYHATRESRALVNPH